MKTDKKNEGKGRKRRNVLFVGPFPPHSRGGGEYVSYVIAKSLKEKGHNVFVLSLGKDKFWEKYTHEGIKYYRIDRYLKNRRAKFDMGQILRYFTIENFNPFMFLMSIYIILRHRIDTMHISTFHQLSPSPVIAAKMLGVKTFATWHSHELFCFISSMNPSCPGTEKHQCGECILTDQATPSFIGKRKWLRNMVGWIANKSIQATLAWKQFIASMVDYNIYPSYYLKKYYEKHGFGRGKGTVIFNFLVNPKVTPTEIDEFKKKYGIRKNERIVMFAGSMIGVKGPQILLKAIKHLRSRKGLKFIFCGYGADIPNLKRLSKDLGIQKSVIFTDWVSREDLMAAYEAADIVTIPSIFPETFSLVFLEAFSTGNIVIASDIGALSENIDDGKTGFLVRPNDPEAFAKRLEYVLSNLDKLDPMRRRVKKIWKEKYDPDIFLRKYQRLFS